LILFVWFQFENINTSPIAILIFLGGGAICLYDSCFICWCKIKLDSISIIFITIYC